MLLATSTLLTTERFYYDPGEPIRFRVDSIEWHENEPGPPQARKEPEEGAEVPAEEEKGSYERAGYRIIAAVAEQGLGLVSWWGENEAGGEEEGSEEVVEAAAATEYELIDEKA